MTLARQPMKLHLRACVCGARPRYGYEAHVARCEKAKAANAIKAALDNAGLLDHALELEPLRPPIQWRAVGDPVKWSGPEPAPSEVNDAVREQMAEMRTKTCPHCGKVMKAHGAHFHIRACHGRTL